MCFWNSTKIFCNHSKEIACFTNGSWSMSVRVLWIPWIIYFSLVFTCMSLLIVLLQILATISWLNMRVLLSWKLAASLFSILSCVLCFKNHMCANIIAWYSRLLSIEIYSWFLLAVIVLNTETEQIFLVCLIGNNQVFHRSKLKSAILAINIINIFMSLIFFDKVFLNVKNIHC